MWKIENAHFVHSFFRSSEIIGLTKWNDCKFCQKYTIRFVLLNKIDETGEKRKGARKTKGDRNLFVGPDSLIGRSNDKSRVNVSAKKRARITKGR